ncbi:non-homologous end-joining DNA ligase [Actinoallomurus rhizosphaericola]|uniref:non-homologous end-joining DNA ligase n=1 Tax=Actinoallomurus rhizosphaericola TaxID=2952536 RepID=UPI0020917DAB|nr:non-homologous end-joining DNA ligase [Actinoallomurus rhizosphaericola]MCO5992523.1 non-homologous end-joining DNA ligase [Actinoallomurus rhizosphaericola]
MSDTKTSVRVDGVRLTLSNLDKVMYPRHGFTKGEVIDYYARIAPVLLPHLEDRPATRLRYPDGVDGQTFFEKNAPSHTPEWVRTACLPTPGGSRDAVNFVIIDGLPALVWCANLAALELHVPQWRVGPRGGQREPDLLVFDLDPGPPATIEEAREVACLLRDLLEADGLRSFPKTSGKKGLHLYVPIKETSDQRTSAYAKEAARRLEREHPDLVVSRMEKRLRSGKVFVDWSQNNRHKTTVAPYSLRAAEEPSVSTPVTWDEVDSGAELRFGPDEVRERVERHGDLLEPLLTLRQKLP